MQMRRKAGCIVAIMTEPVIHTIAKPGTIMNHIQRTLPEIETLRCCAHALYINMAIKNKALHARMKEKKRNTHYNYKQRYAYQQLSAASDRKSGNKERRCSNSQPGTNRLS